MNVYYHTNSNAYKYEFMNIFKVKRYESFYQFVITLFKSILKRTNFSAPVYGKLL